MKAKGLTSTLLLIVLALCTQLIYSQTPKGFTYQAEVRDGSGNPLANKSVSLRITLQSSSATAYYTESKTLTTSGQGVINHVVGTGNVSFGTFAAVPWSTGNVFIKVEIDPNGGSSYTQWETHQNFSLFHTHFMLITLKRLSAIRMHWTTIRFSR